VPPIAGLDSGPYFTSETIFGLTQLPPRLIVIGAGATGLEMAQAFRRLGSEVTVLEAAEPLATEDKEGAGIVLAQLEREGVVIRTGVKIDHVSRIAHSLALAIEVAGRQEMIEGTHLLVATGRKPAIEGLELDAARIKFDAAGIKVNRNLKTSNGRVYAIGDVAAGQPHSTQAASYQAGLVIRNALFRLPARANKDAVPRVTFTQPELAQAGVTEAEARRRRLKIRVMRWPYHDNDRAQAERTTHGHIKVICDTKGKIIGATIVGAQAGELIALWALAIAQRLNIRAVAEFILPYPTLSEIGKRVAFEFVAPGLTRPWVRRIIAWLRIFG
jgi:pyruvate/2-oxoglutarate dehydrogenase complex dihydrolipoamide dehydrogenase (E3) component